MPTALITPAMLEQLYDIRPSKSRVWAPALGGAMEEWDITTVPRMRAFLAQVGHESGRLNYVKEIWGPTRAQLDYERNSSIAWARLVEGRRHRNTKAFDLGNSEPGDGKKYLGRGPIQITGRRNYTLAGIALDLDLVEHPELLEQPEEGARAAGWFWHNAECNELADSCDFVGITRKINGGLNGQDQRMALFEVAKTVIV